MKKIIIIIITGLLLTSGFGLINSSANENVDPLGTHSVFGEYGTATWCGFCKYAHGALKELYYEGDLDFFYVSLVDDTNSVAAARIDDYNIYGFPTVWWDGGYDVDKGAGSVQGAKTTYTASINNCGARSVNNVNINLDATWLGGTNMQIDCTVYNYEPTTYNGTIRVYITDIASSEGWTDTAGNLYTFAFLDWGFDEDISIPSGSSWSDSTTWDGSSHGYSSMTEDNTMLYAVVFDDELNQGYSNPPSGNPFDAYYVDDSVELRIGSNRDPNIPSDPEPENGETDVELGPTLSWEGGDPDWFDDVYYDVYFEADDSTPDVLVSNDQTETTYDPGDLEFDTTYYWQIVSRDNHNAVTDGPIWSFTTRGNDPPYIPSNPDPENGETDVSINTYLSWDGGDPDGDAVTYDVYFGTSSNPPLVSPGQTSESYNPGTLNLETKYYWKIKAEDSYGETSTSPIWSFTTRGNDPPYVPSNPDPEDGETGIPTNPVLDWDGGDPDGDAVYYDVYLDKNPNPTTLVSEDQSSSKYEPDELEYETTYYWKIVSEDYFGETTEGPIWSFTVRAEQQIIPDLKCNGNLKWYDVEPGVNLTGSFTVENIGEPTSELFWRIDDYPDWGTWTFTPDSGDSLTPEDAAVTVQVKVVAPNEQGKKFTGNVTVININNNSDYEEISITLTTPRSRNIFVLNIFELIEKIMNRLPLFQRLLNLFIH
jgi:hypothetical protein